jgi:Sec-independent protein translocase protein TatA
MAALWIILAGVVILVATWRLRRAGNTLDTILREERERSEHEEAADEWSAVEHQTY